jgi:hypothetical protein
MQDQDKAAGEHNPFTNMGMIKFWAISTIVYLAFPVSLIVSYIVFGPLLTKITCWRLDSRFSTTATCGDRGFDCFDLGNFSLSWADCCGLVWRLTATKG